MRPSTINACLQELRERMTDYLRREETHFFAREEKK